MTHLLPGSGAAVSRDGLAELDFWLAYSGENEEGPPKVRPNSCSARKGMAWFFN